ncbi:hypothetical protein LSAT2_014214 [Lamellibrachia satsuma]|nr:hypothetical protein LSAT2_014214 [Lamellibrachia satsuma]
MAQQLPQPVPLRRTHFRCNNDPTYASDRYHQYPERDEAAPMRPAPTTIQRSLRTPERRPIETTETYHAGHEVMKSPPDSFIWVSLVAVLFSPFYGWLSLTLSLKSLTAREQYRWEKAKELGKYSLVISVIGLTVTVTIITLVVTLCITRIQCWDTQTATLNEASGANVTRTWQR